MPQSQGIVFLLLQIKVMERKEKPPRKKPAEKRSDPESTEGKRPGERKPPAAAERTDAEPATSPNEAPSADTRQQPVTNQDEQEKITNAEESDLPVAEK